MAEIVLGIDLGTTNSVAHIWNGNTYITIKNNNSNLFPSVVEFTEKGKLVCNNNYNYNNAIKNIKRFIGYKLSDINILKFLSDLNFNCEIKNDKIQVFNKNENKYYVLEELNALILKFIINKANKQLNEKIKDVVITIPAHFNQIQRDSILISAKLADLNCIRIINEPVAAALAYGLTLHNDVNILIFDLGGGTLDLSILNIDDGLHEVISTQGDNLLGGEDFTKAILNDVLLEFKNENKFYKIDDNIIKKKIPELVDLCEKFKCNMIDKIEILEFYEDDDNNISLNLTYNKKRNEISSLFNNLIERITNHINIILSSANTDISKIDYITLVGGSTKLIEIKNFINGFFKKEPICNLDPDLVVSIGAAIQGYMINNPSDAFTNNLALVDVLPLSIGIDSDNGQMTKIIKKGTKLPAKKQKLFTNDEDYQKEVNIEIYQGERELVKDNIMIGSFKLTILNPQKTGKNIIKIDIKVDNNCMINVIANEKGSDNNSHIIIEKNNELFDDQTIKKMLDDAHKYDEIDSLKIKLYTLCNKLEREINNLDYNCNSNQFINFTDEDKKKLIDHISNVNRKKIEILDTIQDVNIENNDYINAIQNLKKLLKINSKKFPMLIDMYDNNRNKEIADETDKITKIGSIIEIDLSKELNIELITIINNNIDKINTINNISKYTKQLIISYLQNILYKLDSLILDHELFETYMNNIQMNIKEYMENDLNMINSYGNINTINNLLKSHNINYDMMNFYNLNSIQIFDLLHDVCQQFNIQI
jgi:molecular chaperone DnaK (HSP70)